MVTERLRWLALVVGLGLTGGCASGASTDLARVQALAQMPLPITLGPVDAELEPEVAKLLGAPLDSETAVQIAVLNNRALRASLRELGIERGMLIDARSIPNPDFEVELLPERDSSLELRVEYAISELILAPLRAKVARYQLDAARYRAAADVVRLGYQVRAAFVRMQSAHQRLMQAQRRLDALAAARDAALALEQAGSINELDAATQIVSYERARVGVAALELELASRREQLQRLLGLHGEHAGWQLATELPALPEQAPEHAGIESNAIDVSLELAASRSELESLAHKTGLERTEGWLPSIAVDVHALVGNPEAAPNDPDVRLRTGAGLSLSVPLFNQNRGATRAAEAAFDGALERYIGASIDLRSSARELGNRLRSAHASARHIATVVVPAQRRVLDETLLQYNAMQVGVFDLLAAEQALLDVELAELDARAEYWTTHAGWQALLAGAPPELDGIRGSASLDVDTNSKGH
ncbi:TolC family protein [Enhygromyxa salina]|uniref:Cobalt-zinc-cadmium resistance protein CzcC n=1 Tax=Enhygromyxa salina TaxID=215803 RepID=A0A2S9YFM5_9BACT|nr:TolC family protein [Enhygromyxa salina]PRQ03914.1 Cobalt-zinc-cadmium resistance protein CzcC precursor [Enhygromyxa salina]